MRYRPCVLMLALAGPAVAEVDFSGRWALDPARSTGLPPGFEQTLEVRRDGGRFAVEATLVSDNGERVVEDVYEPGAGERDVPAPFPGIAAKVSRRSARWVGERALEIADHVEGDAPGGPTTLDLVRRWELSPDGRQLDVTQALTNNGFTTQNHRVFVPASSLSGRPPEPQAAAAFPVDLRVPVPPTAFLAGGATHLVYELHATSFRAGELEWQRLEVLDSAGRQVAAFAAPELDGLLVRPGMPGAPQRRLGAGQHSVAYLWLETAGSAPTALRHRVTFGLPASAIGTARILEGPPVPVRSGAPVLGPPVRGGDWVARWIANDGGHRRALMPIHGSAEIGQRFAIDWNRFAEGGREFHPPGDQNAQYSVWGQEVLAVADAEVARVVDGLPANTPGSQNPAVTTTVETALGNSISLRLADGSYAVYGHLEPGSIAVREGQRVRRGEPIAKVGNSGNSTGPHLHFHVSTGMQMDGEGLPYVFESFTTVALEKGPPVDGVMTGERLAPRAARGEMPTNHLVVRFP